jgi:hypothetical protein
MPKMAAWERLIVASMYICTHVAWFPAISAVGPRGFPSPFREPSPYHGPWFPPAISYPLVNHLYVQPFKPLQTLQPLMVCPREQSEIAWLRIIPGRPEILTTWSQFHFVTNKNPPKPYDIPTILSTNVRSLPKKMDELQQIAELNSASVICITESWLSPDILIIVYLFLQDSTYFVGIA